MQLWILFRGGEHIRVLRSQLRWDGPVLFNIVRTSLGGIGQMIVAMTSWIFLMRILASIGSEPVATASFSWRILRNSTSSARPASSDIHSQHAGMAQANVDADGPKSSMA